MVTLRGMRPYGGAAFAQRRRRPRAPCVALRVVRKYSLNNCATKTAYYYAPVSISLQMVRFLDTKPQCGEDAMNPLEWRVGKRAK